ncbi:MAG TPA: peptidoglycan-binding domain-containing protein [Phycisphaerae bacterium]|jgi:N-acetylmuramoyl-L-alanine amidase|nr:peptidoglycan-binding domain-containing protein [Phycisphaerae bacterium]
MATPHSVAPGECLSSIASDFNFDDWRTIYYDGSNADFRQLRPNPNLIFPGDIINIPDFDSGHQSGATETTNVFNLTTKTTLLRIVIMDTKGQAVAGKRYTLEIPGVPLIDKTTGGDGMVETEIPPNAANGVLTVYHNGASAPPMIWNLDIGGLAPIEEVAGYQARFNNLDFDSGPVDNIKGPLTEAAIKRFQTKYGLVVDGIVGPITRGKLKDQYGC